MTQKLIVATALMLGLAACQHNDAMMMDDKGGDAMMSDSMSDDSMMSDGDAMKSDSMMSDG